MITYQPPGAELDPWAISLLQMPTGRLIVGGALPGSGGWNQIALWGSLPRNTLSVVAAPGSPFSLRATPLSRSEVELAWEMPDGSLNPDGFIIQRSTDGGATFSPFATVNDPTARSFDATGLDPLTDYDFRVDSATDGGDGQLGDSDDTDDANSTGTDAELPDDNTDSATTTNDEWTDIDTVTPDINSGALSYFNNGDDLAAGEYRIVYQSGAVNYDDTTDQSNPQWVAMDYNLLGINDPANDNLGGQPYPGNQDGVETQATLEAAEYQATPTLGDFDHALGPIGMALSGYSSQNTGPGVTWKLQRYVPHVSVSTMTDADATTEGDTEHPAKLLFLADNHFNEPLTVKFDLSGSATEGDDPQYTAVMLVPDGSGGFTPEDVDLSSGEITIPADLTEVEVDVTAVDDTTSEWTQDLDLRLADDDQQTYVADHFLDHDDIDSDGDGYDQDADALVYLRDNDPVDIVIQSLPDETVDADFNEMSPGATIVVNDDDDNGDGIPDNQADQADMNDDELEPVELHVPAEAKAGTVLTLSMAEADAGSFRVWSEDGTQLLGVFHHTGDPVLSAEFEANGSSTVIVYIEATDEGSTILTLDGEDSGPDPSSSSDSCAVHTGDKGVGNLDVATISHNAADGVLAENLKHTVGAFVPINNDDDDYSATRTDYGMDKDQVGQVVGEDDLIPIYVNGIAAGAKFQLKGPKIYTSADRSGGPIDQNVEMDAPTTTETFYVEGTGDKPSIQHVTLYVNGKPADSIKLNVFRWSGPLNVPQYGTYNYTANFDAGAPAGAHWLDPDGGVIDGGTGTNVNIFWIMGPTAASAILKVNNNYTWDLGVNVVQVAVAAPTLPAVALAPGAAPNVVDGGTGGRGTNAAGRKGTRRADVKLVDSVGPGITWNADVTFNGPTLNGKADRGLLQIQASFVQNLTVTKDSGVYTTGKTATSLMQGTTFWDTKDNFTGKFYSDAPASIFKDAVPGGKKTAPISENDSPYSGPPLRWLGGDLTQVQLIWDFKIFVAALTTDKRGAIVNGFASADTYVGESMARWQFNGTGTVVPGGKYPWTSTGAGVTAVSGWGAPLTPKVTGNRFNDVVNFAGWK